MRSNKLPWLGWFFIIGWLVAAAGSASAQPIAPAPDGTNTVVTPNGSRYDISGGSLGGDKANLFHSFTQFGLSEGQTANFLTNPNIQNILGRINGGNPSLINGLIQVTGGNSNLFLMNPSGIIFGPNASLNVPGSFNATAATGIGFGNNQWFSAVGNNNWASLIGNPNSFAFTNLQPGSIVNAGNLSVAPGQNLNLIGGTVVNTGQLTAPGGNITVMAVPGQNLVRLAQTGNLLSLEIQPTASQSSLPNNFAQPVLSLPQLLTGKGQEEATNLAVNSNGEVVLTGNVAVPGTAGTAIASGSINVSGNTGGNVSILGDRAGVIASNIDASGINGGGNVLIGGDFQGLGTVPNAVRTFVSAGSTINADAISSGNGGRVIVWADETTRFNGNITARGGLLSGNGGFVEVSGKQFLDFRGNVNTLAANGNPGLLLLDPTNITIQNGAGTFTALTQVDQFADPDIGGNTIDAALINSAATNVILQATNDITFNAPVNITTPGVGLNALANNNINVKANITTKAGNVTLNADADNLNGGSLTISSNATINTNGGDFTGIGRANVDPVPGINIIIGQINANGGNIDLTGSAGNTANNSGIGVSSGTLTTSGTGKITLNGTSGNSPNSDGIVLQRDTTITSVDGDITFTGSGSGAAKYGIRLFNNNLVQSTGTGKVSLTGTGGNGIGSTGGISIAGNSKVLSLNGDITLTGTGSGSGDDNTGIAILGLVESTGIGKVTLNGVGGDGNNFNEGINIALPAIVRSQKGDITFSGTGKGSGNNNTGIAILGLVESKESGNITFNGTAGAGTDNNTGISVTGFGAQVNSLNGNITMTGTGAGTGTKNYGISLNVGGAALTTQGNVTLTGDEIQLLGPTKVNGNGTITLQPLKSDFGITVGGTTLQDPDIDLSRLNLDLPELDALIGFSNMVIGRADGTGTIAIDPAGVTFKLPVTIQSPNTGGAIAVNGPITATGGATLTLNGATQLNNNITTQDQIISFLGNVSLGNDVTLNTKNLSGGNITVDGTVDGNNKLNITAGTGTVNFNGPVGDTNPLAALTVNPEAKITSTDAISIKTTGDIVTGNITTTNPGGAIALASNNGNITTALGSLDTSSAGTGADITLKAFNNVDVKNIKSGTGNITLIATDAKFQGVVQGTGTFSLQPFDPKGDISFKVKPNLPAANTMYVEQPFQDALQNGFTKIAIGRTDGTGTISFDRTHSFQDPVTVQSPGGAIVINQPLTGKDNASIVFDGKTTLNAGVATSDRDITFNSPVLVQDNASVSTGAGAGNILFNSTVNGAPTGTKDLILTAGTGNITFKDAVGAVTPLTNLTANSQISLGGNVTTTGTQIYNDAVTIANTNQILTGNGITFNNTVNPSNSGSDLTVNGGTGDVTFSKAVGDASAIANLKVNSQGTTAFNKVNAATLTTDAVGTTTLNGNVTTTGAQTYNDAITITSNPTLSGNGITFNNTVDSNNIGSDLTVNASTGNITFNGAAGSSKDLGNLKVNSTGTTAFNQTVNAASLTTDAVGTTTLNGDVKTTGTQTYNDAVTIANKSTLAGSEVTFSKTVDGSSDLTVNASSGNITFSDTVGSSKELGNLTTKSTGTTVFNKAVSAASLTTDAVGTTQVKGNVTTTNSQTYNNPVTIANDPTLSGKGVTFNKTVDPLNNTGSSLTVDGGTGDVTFNSTIASTNNPIANLTTKSTGTTVFSKAVSAVSLTTDAAGGTTQVKGNVTTTGPQIYNDAVTIANNPILAGSDITFNKTVDVAGNLGIAADNVNLKGIVTTTNDGTLTITITKFGNLNIENNLKLDGAFTQKGTGNVAVSGDITTTNDDIAFGGQVTLTKTLTFTLGDAKIAFGSTLAAGSNPLTLTAGEIDFFGQVSGTGALTLQPANAGQNIAIGGTDNTTPALDLTAAEINLLQKGFSSIAIGKLNGSGNITIPNALTFTAPVTIQTGTGSIALNANITGNDNSSIALNANNVKLGNDINLSSAVGNVSIAGAIDGARRLNINATKGNVLLQGNIGNTTPLTGLNVTALNTKLGGNVTTNNGNININGALGLTKDTVLKTAGGNIAFNGAIDSIDAARNLNLAAGSGSITFNGAVGATSKLGNILIENAGNAIGNSTINAQQFTSQNTQQVKLSGDITAGKVDIAATGDISVKSVTTNGGEIFFDSGNVFTAGNLNTSGSIGGNITVKAITSITAGQINSSGTAGNGGNVFLDPIGDIQVGFINAQGGTNGRGGNVTAITGTVFRATDSFPTTFSPTGFASISTAGGTGGGNISIAHAGGDGGGLIQPFVVGDATINGTAAAITTGQSSIASQSFPRTASGVSNIVFPTDDGIDPTPTPTPTPIAIPTPSVTPTPTPNQVIIPTPTPTPNQVIIPTPTPTPNQVIIPTPTPTPNQVIIPTPTPTPNQVIIPTPTPTPNQVVIPTPTPTPTQVVIPTPTPTQVAIQTPTPTPTLVIPTPTPTPTQVAIQTPTPTPAAIQSSTPDDPEDVPTRRRIPPLDTPGPAAGQILTLDSSITSKLPPSQPPALPQRETPPPVNPTANLVLGYVPPPDRIFEGNDIEKTVWGIEQIRNQEFGEYLGVKANLPSQKVMMATFQQTLKNIEQQTGKRSGIIYIISRADRLELILVPPVGRPIHYSVPEANRKALDPVVKEFREQITNPAKIGTISYLPSAQQLYKWAIAPLEKDLQNLGIQTLLLSVDPGLRSVPFAALHDGKGFLIEKYSFSLIPSFSLTNREYKTVRDATVLAMGRSEFVDNKPLPSVPIELETISTQWRGQSFLNSTFTIDNLNSQHAKGGFRIVHLATHANFTSGQPSNSYIQLWNYKLQLDRMESLNWRNPQVDLLVLSACRTALGDREAELGFGGLAVKSGAKSALGSLWYVDDGGTLGLMSEFYHQLLGGKTKAETLQLTQQAMIARQVRIENQQKLVTTAGNLNLPNNIKPQTKDFSHPYYWSSFTLIGNPW